MGVEKNDAKAFEWYEISAKQTYNNAQNNLEIFYENDITRIKEYSDVQFILLLH